MARAAIEMTGQQDLPESDRLADYPHPRHTSIVHGHHGAMQTFGDALDSGRLHHAWLLSGARGIGKATFAYTAARKLLDHGDDDDVKKQNARLIANLAHPRLLVLRRTFDPKLKRFSASIPVDEVRRVRPFVSKTTQADHWRVVIIDSADDLNTAAANALLKVLEEPPKRTVFLLIASEPGRLLATLRSRCRSLNFLPPAGEDFAEAVQAARSQSQDDVTAEPLTQGRLAGLEAIAEGSVRRALVLADNDGEALYRRIETCLAALPEVNWSEVHAFADDISRPGKDASFELGLDLVLQRIAHLTRTRATDHESKDELTLARRLIPAGAVATWAELWETSVREKAETLALNLDRKSLILNVFSRLSDAASRTP